MLLSEVFLSENIGLEDALNFVSDGFMVTNSKLEVLFFNSAAKTICGLVVEGEYKYWPNYVGVYEQDRKTIFKAEDLPLVRAVRGEIVKDVHLYLKNDFLDEWKCVSCNATPIRQGEEIVGAVLSFRDISDALKRAEEVRKERESYHTILNSLPAYVFTKDLSGNYTFMNSKYEREFECTFGVKPSRNLISPIISRDVAMKDLKVITSKKAQSFEEEYPLGKSDKKRIFQTTRIPLLDQSNEVYGICGISFDITDERERKNVLEEERTKIATASKLAALGMLAAELGHEINNPLAIIRTGSWILRKIISSDNFQREVALGKLDEIDVTIQRINDIVTSIKNLSRDSSKESMNDYLLGDILYDVKSICWTKFHPKGIEFIVDSEVNVLKEKVYCYRVQLSEVFINLIVNAADAIEETQNPWIKLQIIANKDEVIFRFTDNGPGVPPEIQKKIFSPFFSTKEFGKGTGLGLSISKEIMKRHGGDLVLNRAISASCFEVTLPRKS